jgi:anti-anti-sigma factor
MPRFDMPGDGTNSADLRVISELTAVTTLSGEHELVTKHLLLEALAQAAPCPNVVIDLTPCSFLDSSILGVFFATHNAQRPGRERLALVLPERSDAVNTAIDLTGVRELVPVHETLDDALRSLSESPNVSEGLESRLAQHD